MCDQANEVIDQERRSSSLPRVQPRDASPVGSRGILTNHAVALPSSLDDTFGVSPSPQKLALALAGATILVLLAKRLFRRKPNWGAHPSKWTDEMVASGEFLRTPQWKRVRYDALAANDGRCELCGRNKHQLGQGKYLNVDHVEPRRARPGLALDVRNLQVLCPDCNAGKGNRHSHEWRHPSHPHRRR